MTDPKPPQAFEDVMERLTGYLRSSWSPQFIENQWDGCDGDLFRAGMCAARAAAFEECATIAEGYAIDRCSPAWTDRGFHAPDCPYEIGRDVAAAIRERAKEEK